MFSVDQTITLYYTVIKKNKCVFVKEVNYFINSVLCVYIMNVAVVLFVKPYVRSQVRLLVVFS